MTKEEVKDMFNQFCSHLEFEQECKEELLRLKLRGHKGTSHELMEKMGRHDHLIREIGRNREENLLPILEQLIRFIGTRHDWGIN